MATPVQFRELVVARQKQAAPQRKGEITRDRIRLAAVDLLNELGYRDLKVSDICRRARVTTPVLYLYFDGKEALAQDVLREFLAEFSVSTQGETGRTPYQAIYDANLRWLKSARANAGLMRCLLELSDETPEFARLFASASNDWYLRIAQSVVHRFPAAAADEAQIHLLVQALGGMMDEFSRRLFASRDANLAALVRKVAPQDEALAGLLTGIWYRALYATDPPDADAACPAPRLAAAVRRVAPRRARK